MTLNLQLPDVETILKPTITVVGVGGAGGNAVNNMIASELEGAEFVVANTDAQALENTLAPNAIQLGGALTKGLGAGANPEIGKAAAEEVAAQIAEHIEGSNMVFITAGMGGGTGTGAAPVVARIAREQGILTVAVVTKPFQFEGSHRSKLAESGLEELQQYVDTLIIIPNQNLFRIANERTTFADAFKLADEVLHSGVRGVTDLMVKPGLINLDFADIRAVMQEMGKAMMGTGEATGENRAIEAAEAAISNPLLDDVSLKGAKALLINITGGPDMTLFEVDEAANRVRQEVDPDANIIFGSAFNDTMEGTMRVSVVATGIEANQNSHDGKKGGNKKQSGQAFAQRRVEALKNNPAAMPLRPAQPPVAATKPEKTAAAAESKAASEAKMQQGQEEVAPVQSAEPLFSTASKTVKVSSEETQEAPVKTESVSTARKSQRASAQETNQQSASFSARNEAGHGDHFDERPIPNTRGLFKRIADASRVLAAGPQDESFAREIEVPERTERTERSERNMQVKEKHRPEAQIDALDEEQFIDIPAFLRRQTQ